MNIGLVITGFVTEPDFPSGIPQQFYRMSKGFVSQGHRVDVVVPASSDDDLEFEGIYVHRVRVRYPFMIRCLAFISFNKFKKFFYSLACGFSVCRKTRQIHKRVGLDVVQSTSYRALGFFTMMFLPVAHVLAVASYEPLLRQYERERYSLDAWLSEQYENLYYRLARNVFVQAEHMKHRLLDCLPLKDVRVIPTPFFIEVDRFDYSLYEEKLSGKSYLLFVGRLDRLKGVLVLGEALKEVFLKIPDIYAVFVGNNKRLPSGSSTCEVIVASNEPFQERIIFIDAVPHAQLYPIIEKARLVVLPSFIEQASNTLMEALGLGKAVITTRDSGNDDFVRDGENGFLVDRGDADGLAKKIVEIWDEPLNEVSVHAERFSRKFAPDIIIPELIEYYEEICRQ